MRSGRSAEAPVRNVHVDICVVCPVEKVEEFKPDLKVHVLPYWRVLIEVCVRGIIGGTTELHWLLIPSLAKCRNSKIRF